MSIDIEDLLQVGQRFRELAAEAEGHGLRLRLVDLDEPDVIRKAWDLLHDDAPLPSREGYDGPPYTPKQVLTLGEGWEAITHEQEVYQNILAEVRRDLGRYGTRRCDRMMVGRRCRNNALSYPVDPYCWNHSGKGAREFNERMQTKEGAELKRRLGLVSLACESSSGEGD